MARGPPRTLRAAGVIGLPLVLARPLVVIVLLIGIAAPGKQALSADLFVRSGVC